MMQNKKFIPVNTPLLKGNEKKYLSNCIDSGWISSEGPYVSQFEERFAKVVDRKYGIAVSSGTAALEIAVKSLGITNGDEVIVPAFAIISCVAAIVKQGAKPVLVDSDPITWNIKHDEIEKKITNNTRAIMVVHTYGLPVEMKNIIKIARQHNLMIIEDAAEMHGQYYKNKPCGSFGDLSIFSFYPNKHITTGEGGMIVTNNKKIQQKCKSLRNLCFSEKKRFLHFELGWNYRITNLQAAIGIAQLEQLNKFVIKKRFIGNLYNKYLSKNKKIILPLQKTDYAENIYWVYGILLKDSLDVSVKSIMKKLAKKGIGTRTFFWPMHEQPIFKKMGLFSNESYPVAEKLARRGFYIPSGLGLNKSEIIYVAETINKIIV